MDGPLFDAMLKTALEEALRQDAEEAAGRVPRPSVKHRKRMWSLLAGSWKPVRWAAALALAALLTGTAAGYALGGGVIFQRMFDESPWASVYGGAADTEQLLDMGGQFDTVVEESNGLRFEMLDAVSDGQMAMVSVRLTVLENLEAIQDDPGKMSFAEYRIAPVSGGALSSYGLSTCAWPYGDGLQKGQYELLFTMNDTVLAQGGTYEICLTDFCAGPEGATLFPGAWTLAVTLQPAGVRTLYPGRTCRIDGGDWRLERLAVSPLALTMEFRSLEKRDRIGLGILEDAAVHMADGQVIRREDCTFGLNGSPESIRLTMEFQMPLDVGQIQSVTVCGEEIFLDETVR